jgi:hypothetical protein
MQGRVLISAIKNVLCEDGRAASDSELAKVLHYTPGRISQLAGKNPTSVALGNIVQRAVRSAASDATASLARDWARTIVEFYPLRMSDSKQGARYEILDQRDQRQQPLCHLLKQAKSGLYSFYNSEGSIIYVGKTKNNLWSEMNSTFNRDIEAHEIWFVEHPMNRIFARRSRRIRRRKVHLYDTAKFFSAYEVHQQFVDRLETMFIRMLPNNLTNVRIEGQTERSVERPDPGINKRNTRRAE